MTRERTKLLLDTGVLQAWAEGKEIQIKFIPNGQWVDFTGEEPHFPSTKFEWRVKPEPRRWWVNIYPGCPRSGRLHDSLESAQSNKCGGIEECVEVLEVIK